MNRYLFYFLLVAGLLYRVLMLVDGDLIDGGEVDVYLADEGVVGLMGKHILEGRSLPVFFYGQHYLGALEAYLVAMSFSIFGVSVLSMRLVTFSCSIALAALVYRLTYRAYSVAAARWATAAVALGPIYFLQWNLKARGGFVEHMVLLFIVMLLFWRFYLAHDRRAPLAFALGVAAGVSLWVNQLVLPYLFVMGGLLLLRSSDRRGWTALLAGGLLGACLLIGYNVVHPLATAKTLGRKAVTLNRVSVEARSENWLLRGVGKRVEALGQGAAKLGLVFGVPAAADIERLGLREEVRAGGVLTGLRRSTWFIPLLVFGVATAACRPRRGKQGWERPGSDQLLGLFVLVTFVVGYVSPRYMLAAYPLACVVLGVLVSRLVGGRRRLMVAGVALLFVFNVAGWVDALTVDDHRAAESRVALQQFLSSRGLSHCYSAGSMYHLVFADNENTILSPLQKNRYPAYDRAVGRASEICYVYRDDQVEKRQHRALMELLDEFSVSYQLARAGEYNVLYGFSPREALSESRIKRVRHQEKVKVGVATFMENRETE
ncbi:MAG: hypothetical protein VCA74_05255 [Deltaproteobacteria bacterium]